MRFYLLKKIARNKVIQYVFSRYFTYIIQFINSILVAIYLGPYYLGIWGFINLVIQYFAQFNLGVSQSFNALGAIHKNDKDYVSKLFGATIMILSIISLLTIFLFYLNYFFGGEIGYKYNFSEYAPLVCIIAILNYITPACLSLLRIYGNIIVIAITQSLLPLMTFLLLHFYRDKDLLDALVWVILFSSIIGLIFCFINSPFKIKFTFERSLFKSIAKKGIHLFLYSTCFYFIILSTKSIISYKYSVEEFGYFTFSFSLGNAILLLFDSFIFLIFPKVINRLAHSESDEALLVVEKARMDYITLSHLLGHVAILLFPIFIYFIPKYSETISTFNLIALSLIVYTQCFGFRELLIAKGKDRTLGLIALVSLLINIAVAFVLIYIVKVPFNLVIISTMIAYLCFLGLVIYFSRKLLGLENSFSLILKIGFPIRLLIPFVISLFLSLMTFSSVLYLIPLIIYIFLNIRFLMNLKLTLVKILNRPEVIDI